MSHSREESWSTADELTSNDDMDFEPSADGEEEDEQETTLYFDAEDGTLRDEDGDEVVFENESTRASEEPASEVPAEEEENESQTPQASQERSPQTITSMSPSPAGVAVAQTSPVANVMAHMRRPNAIRRLSSATQHRVSYLPSPCTLG